MKQKIALLGSSNGAMTLTTTNLSIGSGISIANGAGAKGFLMAMAMPALAIESVLEGKPWPGCF
jgi:hypothetical protein